MSITIEGKVNNTSTVPILRKLNEGLSFLSRKYYVDRYINKKNLNDLKSQYIEYHQISGRHFNSIRQDVDGKVKAKEKITDRLIKERKEQISATQKTIKKSEARLKTLHQGIATIESYRSRVSAWKKKNQAKLSLNCLRSGEKKTFLSFAFKLRKNPLRSIRKKDGLKF